MTLGRPQNSRMFLTIRIQVYTPVYYDNLLSEHHVKWLTGENRTYMNIITWGMSINSNQISPL